MPGPLEILAAEVAACTRCALAEGRTQTVFGMGNPEADLAFVGEAPGEQEDLQGLPFVGRSGKLLDRLLLEELGLTRDHVWICNTVRCRPPGNRDPLPEEIAACRPHLDRTLELVAPKVIVTLGKFAAQVMLDTKEGISKLRGRLYPHASGAVVIPTYHPAYILRGAGDAMAQVRADLVRAKFELAKG